MDSEAMGALATVAKGDMRRAITLLQSAARFNSFKLDVEALYEAAGVVPDSEVGDLIQTCMKCSFNEVEKKVKEMVYSSYPIGQILLQLQEQVVQLGVDDMLKAEICQKLAKVDKCICDGSNEELQLLDAVGFMHQAFRKS